MDLIGRIKMSSIETLVLKLTHTPNLYDGLVLRHDERTGRDMPWLSTREMFLHDARLTTPPAPPVHYAQRKRAKVLFYDVYESTCPEHGFSLFHTQSGKCIRCRRARPVDAARVGARHEGVTTYLGGCVVHGSVPHSTERGLCLSCYNTLGTPRPASTNPAGMYVARDGSILVCD